ncbi:UNVERIFIED_CONTAM: putative transposon Ty5-1 protein [Sesamum latifolium]|uniref:Transposon Ty5-1 protein n=1 Tax=Sesamum latifolium TaxID=2727402 RepID=A0AAW2XZT3_9LAMI
MIGWIMAIMLRMKEVYVPPNRHIRYVATKAFFGMKMTEGSFVQSHGVKMLSLVEKLKDLKARLENDTYIDATTYKSEPAVLVGEASTSKAKGKRAGRWKRKKGKGKAVIATASTGGAPAAPTGKDKGKVGGSQRSRANDVCMHCQGMGHWKRECQQLLSNPGMFVVEVNMISNAASWVLDTGCGAHICNNLQVVERSRKLSKDEMILRLGEGKAIATEAVGSLSLIEKEVGGLKESRGRRYEPPTNLQVLTEGKDDQEVLCWTKRDRQQAIGLGPYRRLNSPARGGFSYFITFTDDHSWYGYVYLMRYKSEVFGRFKEYILEVENQAGCKIKALRSDRGGDIKAWLSTQFSIKDMGETSYILGIKIYRDRSGRMLGLTESSYIEKDVEHPLCLSRRKHSVCCPVHQPDVSYALSVTSRYQARAGVAHWGAVKSILKYLKRTKDIFLIYGGGELILEGYSDASFQSDDDDAKSQLDFVFKLNGGVVAWKSSKQDTTADSTTEAEYIAASKAAKEAVWMKNYIQELGVVPSIAELVVIFYDNNGGYSTRKETEISSPLQAHS